jgi:hypothetical protein
MAKKILKLLALFAIVAIFLNFPVVTRQAINYEPRSIKIPLYIKIIEFIDRDFQYRRLAGEITSGSEGNKDKALAIFYWVTKNIHRQPGEFDIIDDHILNIVIRRYGTPDQMTDVFTALCVYSGIPAFWDMGEDTAHRILYPLSFAKIGEKWYVFDCYRGKYFETGYKGSADPEAALKDESLFKNEDVGKDTFKGIPYEEMYPNLKFTEEINRFRAEEQMPLKRIIFEIKKALGFV